MDILTLLHERSYGWLALIILLGYSSWFVFFKLSFKIINEKMPPAIYLAIFLMDAFVVGARPFIPHITFVILMAVLMVILLCIFGRLNIYKSIYASVFSIFISFLGDIFLLHFVLGLFPKLFPFIFGSKWGILITIGIEGLFPIIALSVDNPRFSLRLPLRKKSDPFDLFDMGVSWTLGCMYYAMDYALNIAFEALQTNPQKISSSLGFLFVTSFGIMGGVMIIIKCMKFMHDIEIRRLTAELTADKERIEHEKERVELENEKMAQEIEVIEAEKNIAVEKMHNVFEFNRSLDPQMKEIMIDFLVNVAEKWFRRTPAKQQTPFIINFLNMALHGINERDAEILGYLVMKKSNKEIGEVMALTEGHIRNTVSELLKKFHLKDRHELARIALEYQLVDFSQK